MHNKNLKFIIPLTIILIISILFGCNYFANKTERVETSYTKIVIKTLEVEGNSEKLVGTIKVVDSRIVYEENLPNQEISEYVYQNISRWEKSTLEYDIGGMTKDGTLWDGIAETDITKDDFIKGVFIEIYDNWDSYNIIIE